jgi:GxxExxY protein
MNTDKLKYSALTEKVIGAFYDVAYELGPGFLESVYQRALLIRLNELGVQAAAEVNVPVFFHGQQVGDFRADRLSKASCFWNLRLSTSLSPRMKRRRFIT